MTETGIIKLENATRMLAEIRTIDDARKLIDLAEAARVYARQVELGLEAQNHAAEIKLRAQRRAGEILDHMKETGERQTQGQYQKLQDETFVPPTLDELGIDRIDAHRWQTIASLPEEKFEAFIDETKSEEKELTTAGIYKEARERLRKQDIQQQIEDIHQGDFRSPEGLFDVIAIDPPWPYGTNYDPDGRRAASPYPEMSLSELMEMVLPVADDCVLWLWTTHKFMRYTFDILDNWGFRDVAIVTWVKDRMGLGQWLRSQSEFCIMAIKGKPFINLTNQTTIIRGAMREHSRKPDEFYQMVDDLCPGRKLDYFAREGRDGWEVYGHDTEKFMA